MNSPARQGGLRHDSGSVKAAPEAAHIHVYIYIYIHIVHMCVHICI